MRTPLAALALADPGVLALAGSSTAAAPGPRCGDHIVGASGELTLTEPGDGTGSAVLRHDRR